MRRYQFSHYNVLFYLLCSFSVITNCFTMSGVEELPGVSPECQTLLEKFAFACSDFTFCLISNARPIHLCEGCVRQYLEVLSTLEDIHQSHDSLNVSCRSQLIDLDRIEIVRHGVDYTKRMWAKGHCSNCYNVSINHTIPMELSIDTKEFQKLSLNTSHCLQQNYNESIKQYSASVCSNCSTYYYKMNEFYDRLRDKFGPTNVCIDIVDEMNVTRNLWSDVLDCGRKINAVDGPLTAIVITILLVPIVFYILTRYLETKRLTTLVGENRVTERFQHQYRSRANTTVEQQQQQQQQQQLLPSAVS